jgi:ankyrin repeat protein
VGSEKGEAMNYLIKRFFFIVGLLCQSSDAAIYRYLFPIERNVKIVQETVSISCKDLARAVFLKSPSEVARLASYATETQIKTVLPLALLSDAEKIAQLVRGRKIDWEADFLRDLNHNTPLHRVCAVAENSSENYKKLHVLLKLGADINSCNIYYDTPLHLAIRSYNQEIVKGLLAYNPLIDAKNIDGDTALHLAVNRKQVDVVKALLMMGADPNIQNSVGKTPLHYLIESSHYEKKEVTFQIIVALLEAGADPYIKHYMGVQNCFEQAKHESPEIFDFLMTYYTRK